MTSPTAPRDGGAVTRLSARLAAYPIRARPFLLTGILMLVIASMALIWTQSLLAQQRRAAIRLQADLVIAKQGEIKKEIESRRVGAIQALMKEADRTGLVNGAWDERRFSIRQASMSRTATNRLLGELARSKGRIFAADQFDISVKDQQDGLFTPPTAPNSELVVSLRGSLLYRAKAEKK